MSIALSITPSLESLERIVLAEQEAEAAKGTPAFHALALRVLKLRREHRDAFGTIVEVAS